MLIILSYLVKFRKQYMFNDDIVHETLLYFTFHVARGHQQDATAKLASWTYRGFASDPGFCIHASAKKSHGASHYVSTYTTRWAPQAVNLWSYNIL